MSGLYSEHPNNSRENLIVCPLSGFELVVLKANSDKESSSVKIGWGKNNISISSSSFCLSFFSFWMKLVSKEEPPSEVGNENSNFLIPLKYPSLEVSW